MRIHKAFRWIGLVSVLLLGSGGCATRGYVRSQVEDMRSTVSQLQQSQDSLSSKLDETSKTASEAEARADSAADAILQNKDLALGKVGYHEVKRYNVHFAFDSAELNDDAKNVLNQAAEEISNNPGYIVDLLGFADPTGPDAYNLTLGQRRAASVLRYLAGPKPEQFSRFQTVSFGSSPPESQASLIGTGKERRQVAIVLVERTPESERKEAISQR